jgi:hypothetical protein
VISDGVLCQHDRENGDALLLGVLNSCDVCIGIFCKCRLRVCSLIFGSEFIYTVYINIYMESYRVCVCVCVCVLFHPKPFCLLCAKLDTHLCSKQVSNSRSHSQRSLYSYFANSESVNIFQLVYKYVLTGLNSSD